MKISGINADEKRIEFMVDAGPLATLGYIYRCDIERIPFMNASADAQLQFANMVLKEVERCFRFLEQQEKKKAGAKA